jgi:hypothetical protein
MADRFALIARKQEVRQQIERLRRQLEQAELTPAHNQRQRDRLVARLDQLMAEEYTLRVSIDQRGH